MSDPTHRLIAKRLEVAIHDALRSLETAGLDEAEDADRFISRCMREAFWSYDFRRRVRQDP